MERVDKVDRTVRTVIICTLCVMILHGLFTTFFYTEPFWIDEWRIIYNLKFKTAPELWGGLAFMQQFPRLYLTLVKFFTEYFDYNYISLRFPSFMVGTLTMLLAWRIMKRVFPRAGWMQYLLVIVLVSSPAFTKYYVQVKQYTMDIMLSVVALWQILELLSLAKGEKLKTPSYLLLCLSFLLAPFFSYTYPICIAPVFVLIPLVLKKETGIPFKKQLVLFYPLLLGIFSIIWFYRLDVSQLMADQGMKAYWKYNLPGNLNAAGIAKNFFDVFTLPGSGYLFQLLFGIVGSVAFLRGLYAGFCRLKEKNPPSIAAWIQIYCLLVLLLSMGLNLAGKLPLGETRLNAFTMISVTVILISFLQELTEMPRFRIAATVAGFVFYCGVTGNIYTTLFQFYGSADRPVKMLIYNNTAGAIVSARQNKLPIITTPGVAWPYEGDQNYPYDTKVPGDWVLKTHPAYHVRDSIAVYPVWKPEDAEHFLDSMDLQKAVFTDGRSVRMLYQGFSNQAR